MVYVKIILQNVIICEDNTTKCDNNSFTGPKCSVLYSNEYPNCKTCERNYTCTSCFNKTLYGGFCNESCANCPGDPGFCDIYGICNDTETNCDNSSFTGPKCSELCSVKYPNCEKCDRNNTCLKCFNQSKHGDKCEDPCFNCPGDGFCNITGDCLDSETNCQDDTYTGSNCSIKCNSILNKSNCKTCYRNYTCSNCTNERYFGDDCSNPCFNCPGDCNIEGICYNETALCIDETRTGPKCDELCNETISANCLKCFRNYKCKECKNKKYHGDNCTSDCFECSETGCNIQGYCHEFKCQNSTYGLTCKKNCTCNENSDNGECGKFGGQCLNCKFGYFGKNCDKRCYYRCQTELCCLFKDYEDKVQSKLEIKTNFKYIDININGLTRKFEIDYNYGYPLTLFNDKTQWKDCNSMNFDKVEYDKDDKNDKDLQGNSNLNFTNYNINASIYRNQTISITNKNNIVTKLKDIELTIARNVICYTNKTEGTKIAGIIGLGFFNSISNSFFSRDDTGIYDLNILSYYINGDDVELNFGNLFREQIDYVERLTSCEVILDTESDIQGKKMTCKLNGIKNAKYSEGFKLNDAYVTFSIGEKSSLILGNIDNYAKFLEQVYFQEDQYEIREEIREINKTNHTIKYYLYKSDKINKLQNFGFVFNKFFYSYSPDYFFQEKPLGDNNYKRFMIEIDKNSNKTQFILGKDFLRDIKFTINNEEAKIYFYAKNAEFCDDLTEEVGSKFFFIKLDAKESALVSLAIIVFVNVVTFTIIYCVKERRKKNEIDYQRIE